MLAVNCARAALAVMTRMVEHNQIERRDIMLLGMDSPPESALHGNAGFRVLRKRLLQRIMYKYYRQRLSRTFLVTGAWKKFPSNITLRFCLPWSIDRWP